MNEIEFELSKMLQIELNRNETLELFRIALNWVLIDKNFTNLVDTNEILFIILNEFQSFEKY